MTLDEFLYGGGIAILILASPAGLWLLWRFARWFVRMFIPTCTALTFAGIHAPIDVWNRLLVPLGFVILSMPGYPWVTWLFIFPFQVWVSQLVISTAYFRGRSKCHDEQWENDTIRLNSQFIALQDFAELCAKYNIPPEEAMPVVRRGFQIGV